MPDIKLSDEFTETFGCPPKEPDVMDEAPIASVVGLACLNTINKARAFIGSCESELDDDDLEHLARMVERTCMVFNRG